MKGLQTGFIGLGLSVAFSAPVFADATATASVDNLTVTITSTVPHGTPSITWGSTTYYESGYAYDVALGTSYTYGTVVTPTPTATNSAITVGSSASSTITGATIPGTSVSAASSSLAAGTGLSLPNYSQSLSYNGNPNTSEFQSFTLGKDTEVTFSYTESVFAQTTVSYNPSTTGYETAVAQAELIVAFGNTETGNEMASQVDGTSLGEQTTSNGGSYTTNFYNYTSGPITAVLEVAAGCNTYTSVGAVPEPDTYALMAAGLGLFGVVLQRRRSSRRTAVVEFA